MASDDDDDDATIDEAIRRQRFTVIDGGGGGKKKNGHAKYDYEGWRSLLIKGDKGPRALFANAVIALRNAPEWSGLIRYDSFAKMSVLHGRPPWSLLSFEYQRWVGDYDLEVTYWLQHNGIYVGLDVARWAVEKVAQDLVYHPVRDFLNALVCDDTPRLERWTIDYLGCEDTAYHREVGKRWMISAVARVMRPGSKVDHAIILEGRQGMLKSTALRVLGEPWFSDTLAEMGSKDAAMQMHGVWILELAELDSMGRADIGRIKAFMTCQTDNFRPPYGRRTQPVDREGVFAGTVNEAHYFKDQTGNRRFWPLACGVIAIDKLRRDRNLLWAEAVKAFRAGEPWWLDDEVEELARAEQRLRVQADPWQNVVAHYVAGKQFVTPEEVLDSLGILPRERTPLHAKRVIDCLAFLRWRRSRQRQADGTRPRRFVPPEEV